MVVIVKVFIQAFLICLATLVITEKNIIDTTFFINSTVSWYDADRACRRMNGLLASIHSLEETRALVDSAVSIFGPTRLWIGMAGKSTTPHLHGWDDHTLVDFYNWANSEPNGQTLDEMCTWIDTSDDVDARGKWSNADCFEEHYAICKKLAEEPTTPSGTNLPTVGTTVLSMSFTERSSSIPDSATDPFGIAVKSPTPTEAEIRAIPNNTRGCNSFSWNNCKLTTLGVIEDTLQANPLDCQNRCITEFQSVCKSFMYDYHKSKCILFDREQMEIKDSCETYGGPKSPPIEHCEEYDRGCSAFLFTKCFYLGYALQIYPSIFDKNVCQEACHDYEEGCNYWVYEFLNNQCRTYINRIKECEIMIGPSDIRFDDCFD